MTGGDAEIEIIIEDKRKKEGFRDKNGQIIKLPTFYDKDNIRGKVIVTLHDTDKLEHLGIKIEVIGSIGIIRFN